MRNPKQVSLVGVLHLTRSTWNDFNFQSKHTRIPHSRLICSAFCQCLRIAHCIVFGTDANHAYLNYRLRPKLFQIQTVEQRIFKPQTIAQRNQCGLFYATVSPRSRAWVDSARVKSTVVGVNGSQFCLTSFFKFICFKSHQRI